MGMSDFPCWLSSRDRTIALALIEKAGFIYCGRGEVAIEAVKDGAVFGKCLEALPNIDFKAEVRLAKRIIRVAAQEWEKSHLMCLETGFELRGFTDSAWNAMAHEISRRELFPEIVLPPRPPIAPPPLRKMSTRSARQRSVKPPGNSRWPAISR